MKFEEIQGGGSVKSSQCTGGSHLGTICDEPQHQSTGCTKPENLSVCQSPENLKKRMSKISSKAGTGAGAVCCGGGTLHVGGEVAVAGEPCGGATSLCEGKKDMLFA